MAANATLACAVADDHDLSQTLEHRRDAPAEPGDAHLIQLSPGVPFVHALPLEGEIQVGRRDADISIDDRTVSRQHARIRVGPTPTLEDLGSSNGTFLNGRRLEKGAPGPLSYGSVIEFGAALLVYQSGKRVSGPLFDPGPLEPSTLGPGPSESPAPTPEATAEPDAAGDRAMRRVERILERVAPSDISVLLTGETGVGKGRLARLLHDRSPRAPAPFVSLNCAAVPETLFESEIFGHEKGAFTGAVRSKPGLFESAQGGTLFLDEIGEMPLPIQAKLLHVLEQRFLTRLGALQARPIDVRFVSATNLDLGRALLSGKFRRDLWFRLNGVELTVPPLRDRPAEIRSLASQFVAEACQRASLPALEVDEGTFRKLEEHVWPGNVRELRNVMERAVVFCSGPAILPSHLELKRDAPNALEVERRRIVEALEQCAGNQSRAAKLLGYSRQTLSAKLERFKIPRPRKNIE